MNCHHAHEQMALGLYDELDEQDGSALQAHLDGCPDCRSFSTGLERGLGRLVATGAGDLPGGWAEELRERVAHEPAARAARPRIASALVASIGVAAGFLLGLAGAPILSSGAPGAAPAVAPSTAPSATPATTPSSIRSSSPIETVTRVAQQEFRRTTPPPLAVASGDVSRLRSYLRR